MRDLWWGLTPLDYDFATPDPESAARACSQAVAGSAFPLDEARGHWRVQAGGVRYDFTPLTGKLVDDLLRRDYTVNALAANARGAVLGPSVARYDLERRVLRALARGNLEDDPLRPLRGVRLMVTHALRPEARTWTWIREMAARQRFGRRPAWERVRDELERILAHRRAAWGFHALWKSGLGDVYLPEWTAGAEVEQRGFHHLDVLRHQLEALHQLVLRYPQAGSSLRWAALLHDVAKPLLRLWDPERGYYRFFFHDEDGAALAATLLGRLRYGRAHVAKVRRLVRRHMKTPPASGRGRRRWLLRHLPLLPDLLWLQIADRAATRGALAGDVEARLAPLYAALEDLSNAAHRAEPPLLLGGDEVMALLGLEPGPAVGRALTALREAQWLGDVRDEEKARRFVQWWYETEATGAERPKDA